MAFTYQVGTHGTLLWAGGAAPRVIPGVISAVGADRVDFAAEGELAGIPDGERVVLSLNGPEPVRVTARVARVSGGELTLALSAYQHYSRRDYPRVDAPVALAYRLASGGEADISDKAATALGHWRRPLSAEVNLSVAGLAFLTPLRLPEGSVLELRIGIPDEPGAQYEVGATVVRVTDLEGVEGEDLAFRVAVRFTDLDPQVRDAFVDYTLRSQDVVLGLDSDEEQR